MVDLTVSSNNVTEGQRSKEQHPGGNNPTVFSVFACIVIAAGVLGSILMVIPFSKKKYNTFSYSVYFRVLAIVDAMIVCLESHIVLEAAMQLNPDISDSTIRAAQAYCLVTGFIDGIVRIISGSLYFIVPVDRIIVCVMPFRFPKFAKPYTARIVCLAILVFALLMNVPDACAHVRADSKRIDCRLYGDHALNQFRVFKSFGYVFTISFSLTLIFNVFLFVKIKSYPKTRKAIRAKQSEEQNEARISAYFIAVTLFSILVSLPKSAFGLARRIAENLPSDEAGKIKRALVEATDATIVIATLNYAANYNILLILWKSVRDSFKSLCQCKKDA